MSAKKTAIKHAAATSADRSKTIDQAIASIEMLRDAAKSVEREFATQLRQVAPSMQASALNLLHYIAVRRHDVRDLQRALAQLGLSSLGRLEAHVMAALTAVLEALYRLADRPVPELPVPHIDFEAGDAGLAAHATAILGAAPTGRTTRIMVTLPSEAADDPTIIKDLLATGAEIVRINAAHDDARGWLRMVQYVNRAEKELGRRCRVCFDLGGPKLRTGPVAPGAAVVKWRPRRNVLGQILAPAIVHFVAHAPTGPTDGTWIPITGGLLSHAEPGDVIELEDARGRSRQLRVAAVDSGMVSAEATSTAYVVPGTTLVLRRRKHIIAEAEVKALPATQRAILLHPGDTLEVFHGDQPGKEAVYDDDDQLIEPARIGCSLPEVFVGARAGERVFFDDGRLAGVIRAANAKGLRVEITHAVGGSVKLRGEKGINLPDTDLQLPALTAKDIDDLGFAAQHADMLGFSFVQRPSDIEDLVGHLGRLGAGHLGIVLKIETQRAFNNLADLLLTAMCHPPVAVMVARGDLGVEVGFERLSEVQEEILWFSEAAHVPVIWATQVLESLAKGGMPSRAEVTDAAMGSRAECVMLNKGPYIHETLAFLCDVLQRMEAHHEKKTAMLRRLRISDPRGGSTG